MEGTTIPSESWLMIKPIGSEMFERVIWPTVLSSKLAGNERRVAVKLNDLCAWPSY